MTNGKYMYVIDVRSWDIMPMNVMTPENHKTMSLCVGTVKLSVILPMNDLSLRRMIKNGRQANTFESQKIIKNEDLEM